MFGSTPYVNNFERLQKTVMTVYSRLLAKTKTASVSISAAVNFNPPGLITKRENDNVGGLMTTSSRLPIK